jgi:hypothetical protein
MSALCQKRTSRAAAINTLLGTVLPNFRQQLVSTLQASGAPLGASMIRIKWESGRTHRASGVAVNVRFGSQADIGSGEISPCILGVKSFATRPQ